MPTKRADSLISLSHDHHHGLVVCRRVNEGLKRKVDPERIARYVRDFWVTQLSRHFKEEEEWLFVLVSQDDPGIQRALDEHVHIAEVVSQLQHNNDAALLKSFADQLQAHIRFEERELFQFIQQTVPGKLLAQPAKNLRLEGSLVLWPDKFWM